MKENLYDRLLTAHGIRPTANRLLIAQALDEARQPMTLLELEYKILTIDRSNIFRSLTLFKEHHLVHVLEDGGNGVRYELCHSSHEGIDDDMHVHFFCERCQRTFCLEQVGVPAIPLPEGYRLHTVNYMAKGLCPQCARKG